MLKGKKTYITAALIAVATFCYKMGWIPEDAIGWVEGLLGAVGLASLRHAVK